MDMSSLEFAMTLGEELHFGRAARRHYVSAQAFGQRIGALEREVGERLFERTTRRVSLTDSGRAFLVRAARALAAVDAVSAPRDPRPASDDLVVGSFGFGLGHLQVSVMDAFREARPDVRIHLRDLDFADGYDAVRAGDVDAAVLMHTGPVDGVDFLPMTTMPRVVAVPTRSEWAEADWLSEADLGSARRVPLAVNSSQAEWCRVEPERGGSTTIRTPAAIPAAVAATGAVSVHVSPARDFYPHPGVRYIDCEGEACRLAVATRTGSVSPLVQDFTAVAAAVSRLWSDRPGADADCKAIA